jgi:anti-sigma factor ChrR (cupin superfamily)
LTGAHPILTDELRETAALYSLGALRGEEEAEFRRHLDNCAACRGEVRVLNEATALMSLDAVSVTPPAGLRDRVLNNLESRQFVVTRGADSPWKPFGVPGIDVKQLGKDPATGQRTFLLRLQPGAVLPAHEHAHAEHCYVVEGSIYDGDHSIEAGDFELRMAGSNHGASYTDTGAILLIVAGRHDEKHSH